MLNIYLIVPVYNRKHYTKPFLESLKKQTISNFSIIVVDDGSTDGTGEMIVKEFPDVNVLKGDGNYWWTKSINTGIDYALSKKADKIVLFNDDLIVEPTCIEKLIEADKFLPNSLLGCAGYPLSSESGCLAQEAIKINWIFGTHRAIKNNDSKFCESDILPGRGIYIPVEIINKIGNFDGKRFPQGGADYDFVLRARKNGYKAYVCKDAIVRFHFGATGSERLRSHKSVKNFISYLTSIRSSCNIIIRWRFALKHCPWYVIPINMTFEILRIAKSYWFSGK